MANFVYLLAPVGSDRLAVVDPGWDAGAILQAAEKLGRTLTDIVLTHHHADHRNAVEQLLAVRDVPVHVQAADRPWLQGCGFESQCRWLGAGEAVDLGGGAHLQCILTPGHTPGSQCLLAQTTKGPALLTGDTLFIDGCGRCDLPGGDAATMYHTLYGILGGIDGAARVLPGHDYGPVAECSLQDQRGSNPYLRFQTMADFIGFRMRPRK